MSFGKQLMSRPNSSQYKAVPSCPEDQTTPQKPQRKIVPFLLALSAVVTLAFLLVYKALLNAPPEAVSDLNSATSITISFKQGHVFEHPINKIEDKDMKEAPPAKAKSPFNTFPCGTSVSTAREAGCIFDPLTVYWLPARCSTIYADAFVASASNTTSGLASSYDEDVSVADASPIQNTWPYYASLPEQRDAEDDMSPQDSASVDVSESLIDLSTAPIDTKYYTTNGEHLTHCAYMLIRLSHLVSTGETHNMDRMTGHFEHSRHCALMLLEFARENKQWDTVASWGEVRSGDC